MTTGLIVVLLSTIFGCALSATFPFHRGSHQQSPGSDLPRCQQPPFSGLCLAYFQRYYYNATSGKCQDFVYGGCNANQNNFFTEEECMSACAPASNKVEAAASQPQNEKLVETEEGNKPSEEVAAKPTAEEQEDECSLPQDRGLCYALIEKFYYNGEKCETFDYGGCGGNKNNFDTEEQCNKACPKKNKEQRK